MKHATCEIRIPRDQYDSALLRELREGHANHSTTYIGSKRFASKVFSHGDDDDFVFDMLEIIPIDDPIDDRASVAIEKPPSGLMPKRMSKLSRIDEIHLAISRYLEAQKCIPKDWTDELQELYEEIEKENEVNKS